MSELALDLVYGMVLESGNLWGEVASDHQKSDMEAIFAPDPPHRHFNTRPRGGSKTTDMAAVALAWLAADAPKMSNGRIVASSTDQAAILIDAAAALIARTPELEGVIIPEAERIINPATKAWVKVLAQSDSGAWGLRDCHLLVCDEFAQWPETRGAKRVYKAIRTTVQKVPGCRLVILTSAGEPSHWSHEVFDQARHDPLKRWRVSEMPGPVPWQDPIEIEALHQELRPSEFDRLILNRWTEDEDRAIREEDYDRAAVLPGSLRPKEGFKYIATVDIGLVQDATVICISHVEPIDPHLAHGPKRVIVDHMQRWKGSKKNPVQLVDVEDWLVKNAAIWKYRVYADPTQFVGNLQNLNRRGVRAEEWVFTATSVGEVASALVQAFRSRQIWIPDEQELKTELLRVRLRESAPGVTRLDHDRAGHDDQAVVIGMACHIHLGGSGWGDGGAFKQAWTEEIIKRDTEPAERSPRSFFFGEEAPAAVNPKFCRSPRFFDGRCVNCYVPIPEHRQKVLQSP